jgi:asparaginyl-tRNA synthetase
MDFKAIKETYSKIDKEVAVRGWIYRIRKTSNVVFIVLRDSTGILQTVFPQDNFNKQEWDALNSLGVEAAMEIKGKVVSQSKAPNNVEIQASSFKIIGESDNFPISKDFSPEFLADVRHLWIRSRKMTSIFKIRSTVAGAIHEFFRKKGFYEFDAPILQPNQCEGGSTLFEVNYYKDKLYLTQSWQLYAEAAVFALERIYNYGPTFRAEKSRTSRHLSEFWMAEMEAAWMDLKDISEIGKEEIKFILKRVLENNKEDLGILKQDINKLKKIAEKDWPTITYDKALSILKKKENMEVPWGKDLRTIEEDNLMKHFDTPIVVTNYPKEAMAFYKPKDPKRPETALCFDMLAPEGYGEIIGGSQRSTDLEELKSSLKKEGEDISNYEWYLDLRRYGSVPHSGYGVGVERVIAWICGLDNVKDAIPFPRTMTRYKP